MIVLMVAKWMGDLFTEGIYDEHIGLAKVPLLGWEAPPVTSGRRAIEVMSTPVTVFRPVEKVSFVLKHLKVEFLKILNGSLDKFEQLQAVIHKILSLNTNPVPVPVPYPKPTTNPDLETRFRSL